MKDLEKEIMIIAEKYKMNEEEIFSFKISQIWIEMCRKYFPDYNHTHKNGWNLKSNPKKSIVFKICYKLQRETKGLLDEDEYPLYIRAQLEILKVQTKNNPLILVEPGCLVGEKAWRRWKLWKKKYDAKMKSPSNTTVIDKLSYLKAKDGIIKTKKFLQTQFPSNPTLKVYKENKSNLINWMNFGSISPYYAVLSPFMNEVITEDDYKKLNFDTRFYMDCINQEVKDLFNKLFLYEHTKDL